MAYCKQCGNELVPDSSFCSYCGTPIPQEASPAPKNLSSVAPDTSPIPAESLTGAESSAEPPTDVEPSVSIEPSADVESPLSAESQAEQPAPAGSGISPAFEAHQAEVPPVPLAYSAPPIPPSSGSVYGRIPERTAPMRINFVNSFLSLVILGALLIVAVNLGIAGSPNFLLPQNFNNLFRQFCIYGMIATAAVLSTRAKGPDLSIGSLIALAGIITAMVITSGGSLIFGILLSVVICAVIGLLNGVLIAYAHMPAIVTTLLMGVAVRTAAYLLTTGAPIPLLNMGLASLFQSLSLIGLVAALIIAFLLILLTPLGMPTYKREKKTPLIHMFAYMGSGLIAALAGIVILAQLNAASAAFATGYEPLILLVYGFAIGGRAMDNRFAPAFYVLLPALFYTIASNVLVILAVNTYVLQIVLAVIALGFVLIAFLVRPELREKLPDLKK